MTALLSPHPIGRSDHHRSRAALLRRFVILAILFGAAGCTAAPPAAIYDLSAIDPGLPAGAASRAAHGELAIAMPTATSLVDSQRIVIKTGSELAHLKGAQWAERLPELVQARLIESFEKSHRLAAVGQAADSHGLDRDAAGKAAQRSASPHPVVAAKHTLEVVIRRFEADVTHNTAVVEIYARLLGGGGQFLASQDFFGEAPAPHDDGADRFRRARPGAWQGHAPGGDLDRAEGLSGHGPRPAG